MSAVRASFSAEFSLLTLTSSTYPLTAPTAVLYVPRASLSTGVAAAWITSFMRDLLPVSLLSAVRERCSENMTRRMEAIDIWCFLMKATISVRV